MCQLATYLSLDHGAPTATKALYDLHDVDTRPDVFLRYAIHVSYEMAHGRDYVGTVELAVSEGLCGWLGRDLLPKTCPEVPKTNFLSQVRVHYAQVILLRNVTFDAVEKRVRDSQMQFRMLAKRVLEDSD